ncbi:hypothetical protein RE628_26650 [Paenibacillus sp. D2_2]|uniref:hypothetical protein n=1 Tax=Paenibacillus sp. D2_2 TaxID=3073092 RepID=UPI0028149836|nr:hypothetical protein [Paenibacillus sp. D2_2]WMT40676.1 hypothetical protein RE628_26650 [Paenibacillus sp. D2_2]
MNFAAAHQAFIDKHAEQQRVSAGVGFFVDTGMGKLYFLKMFGGPYLEILKICIPSMKS